MSGSSISKTTEDQHETRDTFNVAYLIHFLLGAGNLLPWNAFITAVDYFGGRFPGRRVERVFAVAYMASSLLALLTALAWMGRRGPRAGLNVGFSMFVLSLTVATVSDWVWQERGGVVVYGVMVASVALCGVADGVVAASLMGSAGRLPKRYMQAVFAGTASSGVVVSALRISTKALLPQNSKGLRASAHLYFLVTTMILFCCIIFCNLLYKLPVMEQHRKLLLQGESGDPFDCHRQILSVVRNIKWPAFGVFTIYIVTLSIFPGFIAENLESTLLKDWYPILLITAYNTADLAGKSLTAVYALRSVKKATWLCVSRLLFYPLFTACFHGPKWLKTETPMVVLTFMLGLTNGYLTSVMMIRVPKSVPASEAETCAVVMVVFLGLGLAGGSVLGWFWII